MQIARAASLFSAAAFALFSTSSTSLAAASLCDTSEMEELVSAAQLVYSSTECATINTDFTTATKDDVCDSSCMDYLSTILGKFPDCEYAGTNLYTTLELLLSECDIDSGNNAAGSALASDATLVCLSGVAAAALALAGGN